ncbi:MAG: TolC family protein, partial [Acidobacteriota bacterium]|nr:TolC family protein [Acidobacteriota bacterium]
MTMRAVLMTVLGGLAFGGAVHAQQVAPGQPRGVVSIYVDPASGLDLDGAIAQALKREPGLRAAHSEVDVAKGMRVEAGLRPNPTISFSRQEEPAGMDNQTRVEVVWPLDLFRRDSRVRVAEREIEATRHEVADRERLLAGDVRATYGELAASVRVLSVLDDLFAAASRQHRLVAARVEEGAAPPLERDVLTVDLRRLEAERLLLAGTVERAAVALKRLLGMPPDAQLRIRDTLEQLVLRETGITLSNDSVSSAGHR